VRGSASNTVPENTQGKEWHFNVELAHPDIVGSGVTLLIIYM
jgi:hypothetical protein